MIDIPGYQGLYAATLSGYIYSYRNSTELVAHVDNRGYCSVSLVDAEDNKATKTIHRLMLLTYIGKSSLTVNHKDGDKQNNKLSNLEYTTIQENMAHAYDNGLVPHGRKPVLALGDDGFGLYYPTILSTTKDGHSMGNVFSVVSGKRQRHHGYTWEYV